MKPVRVYDQNLNMLTETDNYLSLQFNPRFYEVGDFELHINEYVEGAEYFVKGNLIVLDKREDKALLIRHREIALDQNGKATENWRITGVALKGVLDQRVTIPPEDRSHDRVNDAAETVMKHYVENHFINPEDPERKIDYIEIAEDLGRGVQVEWESRFKNVSDELTAISKQTNLGWVMYADMEKRKWIFDVVEPRDVTQDNEAGLQPVFFSPDFSTIKSQQFVDSDLNYKNVGYVGGQGEGVERKIVKIGEAKGINLHEVFIDARDVSETDEETEEELSSEEYEALLIERGERRMREFETTFYLEAQILTPSINRNNDFAMSTPFEYETDFRLGDVVEVFNKKWNITMNAPITEFKEIHEPGGFILEAVFGEAQPTLISKIKREFDDLKGIEQQELPARLAVERMREAIEYGDERLSEEERARIEQALEILDESKEWADEQAYQAEQEAKKHADDQDVVYDEEAKRDASDKSDQAREDAEKHAEDQDEIVKDEASQDASDKANEAERVAKEHADDRADQVEDNAKEYTEEYSVAKQEFNDRMTEVINDLEDKADVEYVNGQLVLKADSDIVDTLEGIVDNLNDTAADLIDAVDDQEGRIVTVETDLDTVEGNLNLAISEIEDIDGIITQHGIDIDANATAISFKASQDEVDTLSGDVSSISGSLDVLAGEVEAKAERSAVESLEGDISQVSNDLSSLSVNVEGIEGNVSSLTQTVSNHGTEISDLETARLQHADLIEDRVTKTEYTTDMEGVVTDLTDHETRISQTESDITSKVEQTEFNSVTGSLESSITEVEQTASGLVIDVETVEADIGEIVEDIGDLDGSIDRIDGTLTSYNTRFEVNEDEIGLKASQTDVDTLEGTVDSVEAELTVMAGEISSKVEDGDVRSIFTQEAGSFTFDADQINFDGHVFGGDATFSGLVSGGAVEQNGDTGSIVLDDEGFKVYNADDRLKISMLVSDVGGFSGQDTSLVFWNIYNDGSNITDVPALIISQYYTGAKIEADELTLIASELPFTIDGSGVVESGFARYGVYVRGGIDLNSDEGTGNQNGIKFGVNNHYVSDFQDALVFYPNRGPHGDQDPVIRFRTHDNTSNYRDDMYISGDGTIFSNPTQSNTSSNSSNMRIARANNGDYRFYRTTSARKYKTEIQPIDVDPYSLLNINPKAWYDKREVEENNGLTQGLKLHHGIIANDLESVGLHHYVDYQNGEVEHYDERVWTLLLPITKDLVDDVDWLKYENKLLKQRIEELEKGVS